MGRRRRFAIIALAIGGLLATNLTVTGAAYAGPREQPIQPADQSRIEQLEQQVAAETSTLNAPQYDGNARLPVPAPATSARRNAAAPTCFAPESVPAGSALKRYKMCLRLDPSPHKVVPVPKQSLAATDVLPLPDFCFAYESLKVWVNKRKEACFVTTIIGAITDAETDEVVGTIDYDLLDFQFTSNILGTWGRQLIISVFDGTLRGLEPGTTVAGAATCTDDCVSLASTFPLQPAEPGKIAVGQAFFQSLVSIPGTTGTADTQFGYVFVHPGWASIPIIADSPPTVRCDNALPGVSDVGCVFPNFIPPHEYSRVGTFPELARHVGDAQASGLPGAYPDGPPLRRLTDKGREDGNRNRACPQFRDGGYPRPPTKSCDEYPMASTYQGAATADPQGPARTFDWCQINEPSGTGPTGYSVCMIDAWQNSVGGSDLGDTYNSQRIIDNDPFYVWITGAGDGPNPNPPDFPPVVNAGPDVSGFEGDRVALHGTATDDYGPLTVAWSYSTGPDVDPGAVCFFGDATQADTTIRCTDDGTFTVTLSVSDPYHDEPSVDTATVSMVNVAPRIRRNAGTLAPGAQADPVLGIVAPKPWQLFRVGDPVTLTTTFDDPGTNDTQTCAIAWDDGTSTSTAAPGYVCQATHRFAHAGMYTIKPRITDDDGGTSEATSVMVVVYDPAAGVPQGNGWLNAPGDGGFDFTSSYPLRTATVPDGAVTFALPPAMNLNLRNHQHLDWLVVTPDGKIAIKGTAERIPGQNVGFVLYGYYGCPAGQTTGCQPGPHRLRMVVWDSTANGPIPEGVPAIYDNRAGSSFDVDLANPQNINLGTIIIQHPPIG